MNSPLSDYTTTLITHFTPLIFFKNLAPKSLKSPHSKLTPNLLTLLNHSSLQKIALKKIFLTELVTFCFQAKNLFPLSKASRTATQINCRTNYSFISSHSISKNTVLINFTLTILVFTNLLD